MTESKRTRAAVKQAVYYRNYRRARDRALVRLAQVYPEEYLKLLSEERENDERQGKTWIDLSGRPSGGLPIVRHTSSKSTNTKSKQASDNKGEARDLGGEA